MASKVGGWLELCWAGMCGTMKVTGLSGFQQAGLASDGIKFFCQRCEPGCRVQDVHLVSHHFHYYLIAHQIKYVNDVVSLYLKFSISHAEENKKIGGDLCLSGIQASA